jgi:hypothetical protein
MRCERTWISELDGVAAGSRINIPFAQGYCRKSVNMHTHTMEIEIKSSYYLYR